MIDYLFWYKCMWVLIGIASIYKTSNDSNLNTTVLRLTGYVTLSMVGKNFCWRHVEIFFLLFTRKHVLTFHANCLFMRQFAWNVESCFLVNKTISSICHLLNLPRKSEKVTIQWTNLVRAHYLSEHTLLLCFVTCPLLSIIKTEVPITKRLNYTFTERVCLKCCLKMLLLSWDVTFNQTIFSTNFQHFERVLHS